MPPFPAREEDHPQSERNQVDRHIMGNSLPLMLLHFQSKFCNVFITALDAIGSSVSILRFRSSYKRQGGRGSLSYWFSMFIRQRRTIDQWWRF